jgi:hypothetical protein
MMRRIPAKPAWSKLAVATCVLALALVPACNDDSNNPSAGTGASTPPSPTPAASATSPSNAVLCADAAALRASVDKLMNVTVGSGMAGEIKADLAAVKASVTTLANDARGQWQPQVDALKSALAKLETAVDNLAASPGTGAVSGVVVARGEVNAATQNLLAAVTPGCTSVPSLSPSPGT